MSTQETRGPPVRSRRRRTIIDLNVSPSETRDQEGTSNPGNTQQVPANNHQEQSVRSLMVDVDAVDDDVVESSATAFAEAKNKSRSNRARPVMVDLDSAGCAARRSVNISIKRRRIPPNQIVIDCEGVCMNVDIFPQIETVSNPPPPQEEPTFTCPICMGPFTQEMTTKCGHIFCKECIKTAISQQGKCPTCRKKVSAKELIRVFLPATRMI